MVYLTMLLMSQIVCFRIKRSQVKNKFEINVYCHTNISPNKRCKINIKITPTFFGVNTPSSGNLQVVPSKVINY